MLAAGVINHTYHSNSNSNSKHSYRVWSNKLDIQMLKPLLGRFVCGYLAS